MALGVGGGGAEDLYFPVWWMTAAVTHSNFGPRYLRRLNCAKFIFMSLNRSVNERFVGLITLTLVD